ncbi:hypothetical protein K470DRAFT_257425 [Piedraia hortae CBS 480.64]|uniref:CUE domain-containing protein n=1 Tax=Piedraia hortae CBS 480.64 TaxID=1314780 RepID=A0A6A7C2E9_9PEZI|nr:hypothetical protein K470DRAFT_257425 [Piedraia hortae CBS 480.64]
MADSQPADGFRESDFVPDAEKGQQREAIEQFELDRGQPTQEDTELEQLRNEFPSVDGSLIAALYGDHQNAAAVREVLNAIAK